MKQPTWNLPCETCSQLSAARCSGCGKSCNSGCLIAKCLKDQGSADCAQCNHCTDCELLCTARHQQRHNEEPKSILSPVDKRRRLLLLVLTIVTPLLLYCHPMLEMCRVPFLNVTRYFCYTATGLALLFGMGLSRRFAYAGSLFLLGSLCYFHLHFAPYTETHVTTLMEFGSILSLPLGIAIMASGLSSLLLGIKQCHTKKIPQWLCFLWLAMNCLIMIPISLLMVILPSGLEYILILIFALGGFLLLLGITVTTIINLRILSKNVSLLRTANK